MNNNNQKKLEQLGMPIGTATGILRKNIMFSMMAALDLNKCFQCGNIIEQVEDMSIEHKEPWLDSENPKSKFFDLSNIAFSHLSCNSGASRKKTGISHPSQESYKRGCRCDKCRNIERVRRASQRLRGIKT
jgi:hypothetical protein